ncbi:MAG: hypothetical protein D3906_11545, partial [Candidatus Electrothrix sp. AUS1_2]|nr:hypothetical protein [Candidatus Electrothrix sp. AUS1_2]
GSRRVADARHSARYGLCKFSGAVSWSILHQVREEAHRLIPDAKVTLHGFCVRQCSTAGF